MRLPHVTWKGTNVDRLASGCRGGSWIKRLQRRQRNGQALVELAFVAVILSMVLMGIIELVTIFSYRGTISDASREGVRLASLNYGDTDILNAVVTPLTAHGLNTIHNGQCDIQSVEIYYANPDGSVMLSTGSNVSWLPAPNFPVGTAVEDKYFLQPFGSICGVVQPVIPSPYTDDNYLGTNHTFPTGQRLNPAPACLAGSTCTGPIIGIRINYNYVFHTPVFAGRGPSFNLNYSTVQALNGDNANNFLAIATTTTVPSFTRTNTPTATLVPTSTTIPTKTNTPLPPTSTPPNTKTPTVTATWNPAVNTYTATITPVNSPTNTSTSTPTATGTATSTPTSTPTPIPVPGLGLHYSCSGGFYASQAGLRLSISFSGQALRYHLYFHPGTVAPVVVTASEELPGSPITSPSYPASGYYSPTITAGSGYWYIVVDLPGGGTSSMYVTPVNSKTCTVSGT